MALALALGVRATVSSLPLALPRSSFDVIVDLVVCSKESSSEWLYRSEFEAHRAAVAPSGEEKVGSENEDTNELANALLKKFFFQHGVHHPRFYPSYP